MSRVGGYMGGPPFDDEMMDREQPSRTQLRRERAAEMYVMRFHRKIRVPLIAFKYHVSREFVYQETESLPDDWKRVLDEFGLQALRRAVVRPD